MLLACIGCFELFTRIKRSLGLAFGAYFLHTFSIKIFIIWYSINWLSFNNRPSFLRKISNIWVFKVLLSQLMTSQAWRFICDHLHERCLIGKREEDENTKIWISWERKKFLDEISVRPAVNQRRRHLSTRFYSRWYNLRSGVGALARKIKLAMTVVVEL